MDILGNIVYTSKVVNNQLYVDLSDLSNGIYILNIIVDNQIINKKIIKQ